MTYATQADIESRYPGELAQAGPRDAAGALDEDAVTAALTAADALIDAHLVPAGWTIPLPAPAPGWAVDIAAALALYLATPTALASQDDFKDRRRRYDSALAQLQAIARGELFPPKPAGGAGVTLSSAPRQFVRGVL